MADAQVTIKLSPEEHRDMREALREWHRDAFERAQKRPEPGKGAEARELRARSLRVGQILERI